MPATIAVRPATTSDDLMNISLNVINISPPLLTLLPSLIWRGLWWDKGRGLIEGNTWIKVGEGRRAL